MADDQNETVRCPSAPNAIDTQADLDDDGFSICEGDCNDANGDTHPGAPEICDGEDNNCDGALPEPEIDFDSDGWSVCEGDCNDEEVAVNPGAEEICDNGIDDDCDGFIDGEDLDCIPDYTLDLEASYAEGTLSLDFTIGTVEPAIWVTFLYLLEPETELLAYWAMGLQVTFPPETIIHSTPFPEMGEIALVTALLTVDGLQVYDVVVVDTGMPLQ